jgi:hypothetical protein
MSDVLQQICSYSEVFTNLKKKFEFFMIISVPSANTECNFSIMWQIKTYM